MQEVLASNTYRGSERLEPQLSKDAWRSSYDERTRYDFAFTVTQQNWQVESLTNPVTGERVSANTEDLGPRGSQLTWHAIVNIIILVCGYAFPMRRLEKLLGSRIFRVPMMVSTLDNLAMRMLPVYQYLIFTKLANGRVIQGDDKVCRVNQVKRLLKARTNALRENLKIPDPNWEESGPLTGLLAKKLGFHHLKQDGKDYKTKLFTTVATTLADESDPLSRVVIYRTHFGSFGNFLTTVLKHRDLSHKELVILSDLSPDNNLRDSSLSDKFSIRKAGCAAHARRPFKRYLNDDPDLCGCFLAGFSGVFGTESILDEYGRNPKNVVDTRNVGSTCFWESNLSLAQSAVDVWSDQTEIGKACRYLIRHHESLTYYLNDAMVPPHNNLSEQLLRFEALEDASSFGRDTLEGRVRFDIIRSLMVTSQFAGVDPREYFLFLFLADEHALRRHPELFTPQTYRTMATKSDTSRPDDISSEQWHQAVAASVRARRLLNNNTQP